LSRFKREAQLLASLNHTNIAGIFGFEEADGVHALGARTSGGSDPRRPDQRRHELAARRVALDFNGGSHRWFSTVVLNGGSQRQLPVSNHR
jgi:hypothetical protein